MGKPSMFYTSAGGENDVSPSADLLHLQLMLLKSLAIGESDSPASITLAALRVDGLSLLP
jgi:hypothetical protein